MNRRLKLGLSLIAFFMITNMMLMVFYLQMHEGAHAEICRAFGGDARTVINFYQAITYCSNVNITDAYMISQSNVESTYVIQPVILSITVVMLGLGLLMIEIFVPKETKKYGK